MDTSQCVNCKKPIFFGPGNPPSKKYVKYDDNWKAIIWRHTDTKHAACTRTYAEPVMERESSA